MVGSHVLGWVSTLTKINLTEPIVVLHLRSIFFFQEKFYSNINQELYIENCKVFL